MKMKLLVVDDESDVQFLFQQKFRKEIKAGTIQIKYAINGQLALELIESLENKADYLILTDINMPEMNGLELLKEIKSRYPHLKVFMITAYGDENNFHQAKNLGADDYFTKPLQFDLLKERIKPEEF
jgi:CheY-like chemotaxis protein